MRSWSFYAENAKFNKERYGDWSQIAPNGGEEESQQHWREVRSEFTEERWRDLNLLKSGEGAPTALKRGKVRKLRDTPFTLRL